MNAGATAAAAAAKAARLEEEEMTQYTANELRDDWEFKIVRSGMGVFRNPKTLQRILDHFGDQAGSAAKAVAAGKNDRLCRLGGEDHEADESRPC